METHKIATSFNVPEKDVKIIADVIRVYSGSSYIAANSMLHKIFMSDIRPNHIAVLGFLMGEISATRNAENNLNTIVLCQRQN